MPLKEKAKQLKLSNYPGQCGVFVCDGGCQMLTTRMNNWAEYTLDQVVADFLRQHESVAFVVTIGVHHDYSASIGRGHYYPELRIGVHPRFSDINVPLRSTIERMMHHLPTVETSPENALVRARTWPSRATHYGGLRMAGKEVRLSAITVLQLLAGELDYSQFAQAHGCGKRLPNPFAKALRDGRVVERCAIEKSSDEDDDWITFEFGEPDPAIHQFTVP